MQPSSAVETADTQCHPRTENLSMLLTATTLTLVIICTSVAQVLQKQAALSLQTTPSQGLVSLHPALIKSVVLLMIGMALWLVVLSRLDVSVAYPLLSANFVVVPLLARWKLGEKIPLHRMFGAMLIIAGVITLFAGNGQ